MAYAASEAIVESDVTACAAIVPELVSVPGSVRLPRVTPDWIVIAVALPPSGPPVAADIVPRVSFVKLTRLAPYPSTMAVALEADAALLVALPLSLVAVAVIEPLLYR